MRYRMLDENGDYLIGQGQNNFYINQPEAVAQAILTRLRLVTGEWYLDTSAGTPYPTQIQGKYTDSTRDTAIRQQILGTEGVTGLVSYSSEVDPTTRKFSVTAVVSTQYGETTISTPL